jgi:hypothetical protein
MDSVGVQLVELLQVPKAVASNRQKEPLTVLYIAGAGRSGSTLLTNLLGQQDHYHAAGEVYYLWERGINEDRLCGCGRPIRECPLWSAVLERTLGELGPATVDRMANSTRRLNRTRRLLSQRRLAGGQLREEDDEYLRTLERLYLELAAESGSRVIIDASKNPLYGHLLTRSAQLRVRTVHLIRDPRAVAFSWRRHKWNPDSGRQFARLSTTRSALLWRVWNHSSETLLGRDRQRYQRLRYEDLCRDGAQTIEEIMRLTGVCGSREPVAPDGTFRFMPNHAVAGNPVRYSRERVSLSRDDEWRARMPAADRLWVTLLTRPLLRRYGYPPR